MQVRGISTKNIAKFKDLTSHASTALLLSATLLVSACSSSGGSKEASGDTEIRFAGDDIAAVEAPAPVEAAAAPQPADTKDDFKVTIQDPDQPSTAKAAPAPKKSHLRPNAPDFYIVKKGDTLWDIASKFLQTPWTWPELWYFNPQVVNPHLIYPGDKLVMTYIDGQLRLTSDRHSSSVPGLKGTVSHETTSSGPLKVVKLKPRIRKASIDQAITTVSYQQIGPFLASSRVLTEDQLNELPVIVGSLDDHLVSGLHNIVYAEGIESDQQDYRFEILRAGRPFISHTTGEVLGYEGVEVGKARLEALDNETQLASFQITENVREVLNDDLLLPSADNESLYSAIPRAPKLEIKGNVIALHDAIANVATNQVVVIDIGARDGLESGNVIAIDQAGALVRKRGEHGHSEELRLPKVNAGLGLVFKVFDRVSYVLIVDSHRAIHIGDSIRNPDLAKDRL